MNYGFSKCQIYQAKERKLPKIKVKGGKEEELKVEYAGQFVYVDTSGVNLSDVKETMDLPEESKAPVKEGDTIGKIIYQVNGKDIGSTDLIAVKSIEKAGFVDYLKKIWKKLL